MKMSGFVLFISENFLFRLVVDICEIAAPSFAAKALDIQSIPSSTSASPMIVRALVLSDWQQFRDIRLHALASCPGAFSTSYAQVKDRTEDQWKQLITGSDRQVVGLFDEKLVGIAAVFVEGVTATFAMAFILPQYRGRGLSRLFFDARLAWANHRKIDRVVVGYRRSNEASARAIRRYGFKPFSVEPRRWPDGAVEDEISCEISLR